MVKWTAFTILLGVALTYLTDLAIWTARKNPTGVVTIHPYTAVPRNDKREEIIFDDPHDENCVNSLFPHGQWTPCWYLRGHSQRRNNL